MMGLRWAFEEDEKPLAVSRLAEAEREAKQGDVYDNLYDEIHRQAEAEKKADEVKEDEMSEEEDTDAEEVDAEESEEENADEADESSGPEDDKSEPEETSDNEEADPDTASEEKEANEKPDDKATSKETEPAEDDAASKDTQKALESLSLGMESLSISLLALGDEFEPHLLTGVNNGIYLEDHVPNLARIGFKYGKLLLKHVYKGVAVVLDTAVKGLYKSGQLFVRSVREAVQSYERQQKAIEDLKKAVEALSELDITTDTAPKGEYKKAAVIQQLKIGESAEVWKHLRVADDFIGVYYTNVTKAVKEHLYTTQRLIDTVVDQKLSITPERLMKETMKIPGFKAESLDGYAPKSSHLSSFIYEAVLPGDVRFIAWLPDRNLNERKDIIEAYQEAKFFFGVASQDIALLESIPYLAQNELETFLDLLNRLCDRGLQQRQIGPDIIRQRDGLKKSLLRYLAYLMTSQDRISIDDSCAEYIALRSRGLDKTYLSGLLHVDEYQRRLISAGIQYAEACIKALRSHASEDKAADDTVE